MNATEEMLSEVFKKFGPIKPNGIQVRSFKENKNCFGFVEFESATSVLSAVMASPITIDNRQANIEEKQGKLTYLLALVHICVNIFWLHQRHDFLS
ncbi:hypothetical protein CRYUN_Cryun29cG0091500 [Craigia yunnanensis]